MVSTALRRRDRRTDGQKDGWKDRQTDRLTEDGCTDRLLPTETLGYLSKAIDRKQEGRVAIATQAAQEVARGSEAILCGCVFCHHGN